MAIQNTLVDIKLQIRVEDTSTGETKVKNLNFTRIKCAATSDELYGGECDRRAAVASAVGHPHGGDRRSG